MTAQWPPPAVPPTDRPIEPRPPARARNPVIGFYFATLWLVAGVSGAVALVLLLPTLGELSGKAAPFVVINPPLVLGFGVFCLVRAVLAIGPWLRYREATSAEARAARVGVALAAQGWAPLVVVGTVGLVASAALVVVFSLYAPGEVSVAGRLLQVELLALILLPTTTCLGLLMRKLLHR